MLAINDISIRIAGRLLIDHSSVQIVPGARVGFVGRNGVGKSTLFHAIRGDLPTESGTIAIPPRWQIGSLAQEAPNGPEKLVEVVLKADRERETLMREAEVASDPTRIAEIQTRLVDIEAHSAPARAAAILSGLGFSAEDQNRPCAEFSGGWRMRVALAATLFAAPDLLLLDEPTNYLDLEGTLWLEDHLANYPRTVIVISHDRDLLETSVDQILHLDRGKLTLYKGSYSSFEEQRATRELLDAKHARRQADERKRLQAFVDRFKAKASKARQAQSRVKMLERMKPVTALVTQDVREITFPQPEKMLKENKWKKYLYLENGVLVEEKLVKIENGIEISYEENSPTICTLTLPKNFENEEKIKIVNTITGEISQIKVIQQPQNIEFVKLYNETENIGTINRLENGLDVGCQYFKVENKQEVICEPPEDCKPYFIPRPAGAPDFSSFNGKLSMYDNEGNLQKIPKRIIAPLDEKTGIALQHDDESKIKEMLEKISSLSDEDKKRLKAS